MLENSALDAVLQMQKIVQYDEAGHPIKKYDVTSLKNQTSMSKIYFNPNYPAKNTKIYVNPCAKHKPSIHVNPKILNKNLLCHYNQEANMKMADYNSQDANHNTFGEKPVVYVNRKLMSTLIHKLPEDNQNNYILSNLESASMSSNVLIHQDKASSKYKTGLIELPNENKLGSIHKDILIAKCHLPICLNTCLFPNLCGINKKHIEIDDNTQNEVGINKNLILDVQSNTKCDSAIKSSDLVKLTDLINSRSSLNPSNFKNACNTYTVCKHNYERTKILTLHKGKQSSPLKKSNYKYNCANMHVSQKYNISMIKATERYNINLKNKIKKNIFITPHKHVTSKITAINSNGLVSIDGIIYKKSRNQLIRQGHNLDLKYKQISSSCKNNQYFVPKSNSMSVSNISETKVNISVKNNLNVVSNKNSKTNASNKVKQKSLQILRNKMRKNNQPCLLFQKFGYCANQINDACLKVHDKNQVALCKSFLQGECLSNNCLLSHNIGPEKMPTCKYFLEGCCTRDRCPYLHVKVSSKSPICVEFLRGYCSQGHDCQKRHVYICPEFEKSSKCSKTEFCPYPHKRCATEKEISKKYVNPRSKSILKCLNESKDTENQFFEYRKRYYEETKQNLGEKKEDLLKLMNIKTGIDTKQISQSQEGKIDSYTFFDTDKSVENSSQYSVYNENLYNKVERTLIGPLPSYIPINE